MYKLSLKIPVGKTYFWPMSESLLERLDAALIQRRENGNLRTLKIETGIDFYSNDYLGYADSKELQKLIKNELNRFSTAPTGSKGSRLLAGNSTYAMDLEHKLAEFFDFKATLLFNSGFDANLSLLSTIPRRNDTIIYDELVHASIHAGMRLGNARTIKFTHNDAESLREKIALATGTVFVVVESLYSMDGDVSPLALFAEICISEGAYLIVDEAHSTGIFGEGGRGLIHQLNLQHKIFAIVHTFGKGIGAHGASVSGSELLKEYLINFARSFIYSTALPFHTLACINTGLEYSSQDEYSRSTLMSNINFFKNLMLESKFTLTDAPGPVQSLILPGNERCKKASKSLNDAGFAVRAILAPTVASGTERLRICIHSFNTETEIWGLVRALTVCCKTEPENTLNLKID